MKGSWRYLKRSDWACLGAATSLALGSVGFVFWFLYLPLLRVLL